MYSIKFSEIMVLKCKAYYYYRILMKDLRVSEILHKWCRTKARKDVHIMMTIRSSVWSTI